jgi:hypothetical protein
MGKIIHILLIILLIALLSLPAVAAANHFIFQNVPGDSIPVRNDSVYSPKKICSCLLMQVKTGAFDSEQELVGIFAEKTLEGKLRTNYKILNEYIRREKIYFRIAFLESLVLRESFKTAKDCSTLYKELKGKISNLRMYNIIDVDALTMVARR